MSREHWLNGWPRIGRYDVLIGTGVHCVGCGKYFGITTVAFPEDYQPPEKYPDFPFDEATCPIHERKESEEVDDIPRVGVERMRVRSLAGKLPH